MRATPLATLVLSLSLLGGCEKPRAPTVTAKAARATAVTPSGVNLLVEFDVYNPNSFPLLARSVEGALTLSQGKQLGTGTAEIGHSIAPKETVLVKSALSIPWSNLDALLPLATSPEPVPYRFIGVAKVGGERLNVSVPFELTGELTRTQLLEIGLRGLPR